MLKTSNLIKLLNYKTSLNVKWFKNIAIVVSFPTWLAKRNTYSYCKQITFILIAIYFIFIVEVIIIDKNNLITY